MTEIALDVCVEYLDLLLGGRARILLLIDTLNPIERRLPLLGAGAGTRG